MLVYKPHEYLFVISIINHRSQPLIRQLNAIHRGPHAVSIWAMNPRLISLHMNVFVA